MPDDSNFLFFSRGRGRGHAIPDLCIARELRRLEPATKVLFVSYGTGADTLRLAGEPVLDLELAEDNAFLETAVSIGRLFRETRTEVVVSHEEFAAPPIAKAFDLPSVFLTHWFPHPDDIAMEALRYAGEILFIERPDVFPAPNSLRDKIRYLPPIVRPSRYSRDDRRKARAELGFASDEAVILMLPGGWFIEQRAPCLVLVAGAFRLLNRQKKRLIWIAGKDQDEISTAIGADSDITVIPTEPELDRLLVASDVAITKGTYNTGKELASLGIPSISLSYGLNAVDDLFTAVLPTNTAFKAPETDCPTLAVCIEKALDHGLLEPDSSSVNTRGATAVAQALLETLHRTRRASISNAQH